jgi:dienelactone hydrolase
VSTARRLGIVSVVLTGAIACFPTAIVSTAPPAVTLRVVRLVDHSRVAHFRNGSSGPRVLITDVLYPTRLHAPFPLIVFGHGFALTPQSYSRLLRAWARAGYIVAAPVFPVENRNAPGGPDEGDLVNQPADMSFVLTRLTAATSPLRRLIDPGRIAFAGQSDGAETAFSAAYDRRFIDRRVDAAVVMSGAALPGFTRPPLGAPPLLAVQGTRDPINVPATTAEYYGLVRRPKFLLWLLGATHLPPFTTDDRWATAVDRTTVAFLDHVFRGAPLSSIVAAGSTGNVARITSDP